MLDLYLKPEPKSHIDLMDIQNTPVKLNLMQYERESILSKLAEVVECFKPAWASLSALQNMFARYFGGAN